MWVQCTGTDACSRLHTFTLSVFTQECVWFRCFSNFVVLTIVYFCVARRTLEKETRKNVTDKGREKERRDRAVKERRGGGEKGRGRPRGEKEEGRKEREWGKERERKRRRERKSTYI